jgi:ElaB/YqjD/DUF883 family membrane-anchored ribosome-binding protein
MPDVSTAQKDRLMNDLRTVIADAEELMRTTTSEVGEGAQKHAGACSFGSSRPRKTCCTCKMPL